MSPAAPRPPFPRPFLLALVAILALAASAPAATLPIASGLSVAEAAAEYQRLLLGGAEGPPQIVESACDTRFGGRLCPQLAPGVDPVLAERGAPVATSGRWFFVPPLPVADLPEGPRLGDRETTAGQLETWLMRRSFVASGGSRLEDWRRQAESDALVDCTVAGCQIFAFAQAPDRPADEEWLLKCWVEVADGVRGAPYGCRQIAAIGSEEAWLRARMAWSEEASPRPPSPPFHAVARCERPLPDAAHVVAEALERPPLDLAARELLGGNEVVAVAAPRPSSLLGAVAEWPSLRLRLIEARQGGPQGAHWAYGLEIDQHVVTAPLGSGAAADWQPIDAAARSAWEERLRGVATAALVAACGRER